MSDRLVVLAVALLVAVVVGVAGRWLERRTERRGFQPAADHPLDARDLVRLPDGARGAVVVLGTKACVTCARTFALLDHEAAAGDGSVVARHVLVEDHPEVSARLDVRTAPTVVILDSVGTVIGRHDGGLDAAGARDAVAALMTATAR